MVMESQWEWLEEQLPPTHTEMKLMRARLTRAIRERQALRAHVKRLQARVEDLAFRLECAVAVIRLSASRQRCECSPLATFGSAPDAFVAPPSCDQASHPASVTVALSLPHRHGLSP